MAVAVLENGSLVPNPARQGSSRCVDAAGKAVPCCSFELDTWATLYMVLWFFTFMWTLLLAFTLRVFVVSGTIAQW